MTAYYNEFNRKSAAALRQLIADGLIAPGDVDERSILDVTYDDIKHYTQCHFFAGIGGWSLALRMAGWPDDRPVWTGSCPCQPFSEAGGRLGLADERHLWPFWYDLIAQRGDGVLFGEQVDAAIRYGWLDLVRDDLEAIGHAIAAVGLPAACVGAPHIRQRLWFVADGAESGRGGRARGFDRPEFGRSKESGRFRDALGMADGNRDGFAPVSRSEFHDAQHHVESRGPSQLGVAQGDAERARLPQRLGFTGVPGWALGTGARQAAVGAGFHADAIGRLGRDPGGRCERVGNQPAHGVAVQTDATASSLGVEHAEGNGWLERWSESGGWRIVGGCGPSVADAPEIVARRAVAQARTEERRALWRTWDSAIWIDCKDGKRRPIEPSIFPLAHGVSERVGLLHGSGNAIVPAVAAAFIEEYLATRSVI